MVFRADKWHIYLYARKVYTFFVAEDTTVYNGTDNVMTFDLFDFKSDQTIIDQNHVPDLHIIDQTFVCQRNFCFISFDFFIRQSDCLAFF